MKVTIWAVMKIDPPTNMTIDMSLTMGHMALIGITGKMKVTTIIMRIVLRRIKDKEIIISMIMIMIDTDIKMWIVIKNMKEGHIIIGIQVIDLKTMTMSMILKLESIQEIAPLKVFMDLDWIMTDLDKLIKIGMYQDHTIQESTH